MKSRSASGITTAWFFAPPSACTRLPLRLARSCTYCAMGVEPTNDTASTSAWSRRASTTSLSPFTTLKTPSGKPASAYRRAISSDAPGSRSLGLSTNVFPQAMATGCIHMGTMIGKLNGVIPVHTPSGCRKECESTPPETWSLNSPLSSCGIPQTKSTTSRPRTTSPRASSIVLPCSLAMIRASSSVCSCDQLAEPEHQLRPRGQRRLRPVGVRRAGSGNGCVDIRRGAEHYLRLRRAAGRVEDVPAPLAAPRGRGSGNPVLDRAHAQLSSSVDSGGARWWR